MSLEPWTLSHEPPSDSVTNTDQRNNGIGVRQARRFPHVPETGALLSFSSIPFMGHTFCNLISINSSSASYLVYLHRVFVLQHFYALRLVSQDTLFSLSLPSQIFRLLLTQASIERVSTCFVKYCFIASQPQRFVSSG